MHRCKRSKFGFGLLLLGLLLVGFVLTACERPAIQELTLDNGLKVVVKEDHRTSVVMFEIWYRVGIIDESPGKTGLSHVLEHMMFKGTDKYKNGAFNRIIAELGGSQNAFTAYDYTGYFEKLESSRLPIAMALEADRMTNLVIDPKELRKEAKVVMDERLMRTDNSPSGKLYEQFQATAYTTHSYGLPLAAHMRDLRGLTVADLEAWYRRWYAPNNATVVVVGDVEPKQVFAQAKKYFGHIKRRPIKRTAYRTEPRQTQTRRSRLKFPANVPTFMMGFHVPVVGHADPSWEPYALSVLVNILDGGISARFETELVRRQRIATSVGSYYDAYSKGPTLFAIAGTPSKGRSVAELERAVLTQVELIKTQPIRPEEMARVKAQVIASQVFGRDSLYVQARLIGTMETTGRSWREIDRYVERIKGITPAQVQAVARKYLVPTNMTVSVLDPLPIKKSSQRRRQLSGSHHGRR